MPPDIVCYFGRYKFDLFLSTYVIIKYTIVAQYMLLFLFNVAFLFLFKLYDICMFIVIQLC